MPTLQGMAVVAAVAPPTFQDREALDMLAALMVLVATRRPQTLAERAAAAAVEPEALESGTEVNTSTRVAVIPLPTRML